jgi:hypothetical protein
MLLSGGFFRAARSKCGTSSISQTAVGRSDTMAIASPTGPAFAGTSMVIQCQQSPGGRYRPDKHIKLSGGGRRMKMAAWRGIIATTNEKSEQRILLKQCEETLDGTAAAAPSRTSPAIQR